MSTQTDKIREAIERAMARIGCPPGDNADADLYRELQDALSELEAQPAPSPSVEQRVEEIMEVVNEEVSHEPDRWRVRERLTSLLTN